MWTELISELFPEAQFEPPGSDARLGATEGALAQPIPSDLKELLREADGVRGEFDVDVVWSSERIARDNADFRSRPDFADLYDPFGDLIFFGDNGGGDQFAFKSDPAEPGVFVWEHETDGRRRVADDLRDYLEKCLTSEDDEWYVEDED